MLQPVSKAMLETDMLLSHTVGGGALWDNQLISCDAVALQPLKWIPY